MKKYLIATKKTKLIIATSLLLFTLTANAILPLIYGAITAGTALLETGGAAVGLITMTDALIYSASAHLAVFAITFEPSANAPVPNQAPLEIRLDPKKSLSVPAGWQAGANQGDEPIPPQTTATTYKYTYGAEYYDSAAKVAQAFLVLLNNGTPGWEIQAVTEDSMTMANPGHGTVHTYSIGKYPTCPTGYSPVQNSCTLINPQQVKKPADGKCEAGIVDGGIKYSTNDPDCASAITAFNGFDTQVTNKLVASNPNTKANTSVEVLPSGIVRVTEQKPTADGNTSQKTVDIKQADGTNAPYVVGSKTETLQGQGSLITNNSSTGGSNTPQNIEVQFDKAGLATSSLQSEGNAKLTKIEQNTNCDTCTLPEDKTVEEKAAIDAEIKKTTDSLENVPGDYQLFKDLGWSNWIPSFPSGSCTPITDIVKGVSYSINICPSVEKINLLIGWLWALFGAWTITGIFFSRSDS